MSLLVEGDGERVRLSAWCLGREEVVDEALEPALEAIDVLLDEAGLRMPEPHVVGRALDFGGRTPQDRSAERARVGRVLCLEQEEPGRATVELLRHGPDLAGADYSNQAGFLEDLDVVPDGSLGHPELDGELLDRARSLAEEGDDRGADVVGECAQLVPLADDENVVGFVVGEGR
jgi:hypothetical protein